MDITPPRPAAAVEKHVKYDNIRKKNQFPRSQTEPTSPVAVSRICSSPRGQGEHTAAERITSSSCIPSFRLLATIDAQDADLSHFAQLDNNGRYYYLSADYTFAYWSGSFAGSPVATVILEYREDKHGGGYHLALDKMRRPAPTKQEWETALAKVKGDVTEKRANMVSDMRTDLWNEVLHLLYTGHSDLAWKFVEEAGPETQTDPDPDLSDFCSTLKASD